MAISPAQLRKQIRNCRRALSPIKHQQASCQLVSRVIALDHFTHAQHIAGYFSHDNEPDLTSLFDQAWVLDKQIYLPIVDAEPHNPLLFAPYSSTTPLTRNQFGIPEPDVVKDQCLAAGDLDLVLTPLVAFDEEGNRLGMGGGYYDRTFAFRADPAHPAKPYLLGLAFELQKVTELPSQSWDVPLDGIVTEAAVYQVDRGSV